MVASIKKQKSSGSKKRFIGKPNGLVQERVQAVGPERFGIVAVDCAKRRSKYMLCNFYGKVLVEPAVVEHTASGLRLLTQRIKEACQTEGLTDCIVAIEMTGIYHKPVQRAFRKAGFDTRIVHPFASHHYRRPLHPDVKTDDHDPEAIFHAAVNGYGLATLPVSEVYQSLQAVVRARRPKRLPVVLTVDEVSRVMTHLSGDKWLIAMLLYGGGLRLLEELHLRVKDLDFERGEITVREGKGDKDRVTMLPQAVIRPLQEHFRRVEAIHQQDSADGYGRVELPHALARKYPNANREWRWQFVFPQERRWRNPQTGEQGRHHVDESLVQRAVAAAVRQAGLTKRVASHTFRHSFATHLLADGYDIRTVQELLGHSDVRTTMIYTHVLNRGGRGVRSPADVLARRFDER